MKTKGVLVLGILSVLGGACGKNKVAGGAEAGPTDVANHQDAATTDLRTDTEQSDGHVDLGAGDDSPGDGDAADTGVLPDGDGGDGGVRDALPGEDGGLNADGLSGGDGTIDADVLVDRDGAVDGDSRPEGDLGNDGTGGPPIVPCSGLALALTCGDYCGALRLGCTGANSQFPGADQNAQNTACLASCNTWSCGQETDMTGNSLNCRANRAITALGAANAGAPALELETLCRAAGRNSPVCM